MKFKPGDIAYFVLDTKIFRVKITNTKFTDVFVSGALLPVKENDLYPNIDYAREALLLRIDRCLANLHSEEKQIQNEIAKTYEQQRRVLAERAKSGVYKLGVGVETPELLEQKK